jgi:arylsulfatase
VTVDTLRPDHMSVYGYERPTTPALERWFEQGAALEHAWSTAASTPPGVMSVLTGLLPQDHGVRTFYQLLPDATVTLADRLADSHQTAAFVSNAVLAREALGLAGRFEHWDDAMDTVLKGAPFAVERRARATTDAVLTWLGTGRDAGRPLFLWVHYMDPHGPYTPPDGYAGRFRHEGSWPVEPERIQPYQRRPGAEDALDWVDDYDAEIMYVDAEIGRMLDGWAESSDVRFALLLLTADHGEALLERGRWFRHRFHVFEEIVRVPLLLRGPGVTPGPRDEPASVIDVVPTVLGFVGRPAADLPGRDLRAPAGARVERSLLAEASTQRGQWRAARRGDTKAVVHLPLGEREPDRRAFFDLREDPGETRPRGWNGGSAAARDLLDEIGRDPDPGGLPISNPRAGRKRGGDLAPPDEEAQQRLRALGYLE